MAGKEQPGERQPLGRTQNLDRIILAGQVLGAVLLVALLLQWAAPVILLYGLLSLTVLTLVLQVVRLLLQRSSPEPAGAGLAEHVTQLLSSTADPTTAAFNVVCALQQHTGLQRVALFATDSAVRHAESLAEAQSSECRADFWGGRLPLERLPVLAKAVRANTPTFWPDLAALRLPAESLGLLGAGQSALYLYPLRAGNAPVGFLALTCPRSSRLPPPLRKRSLGATAQILGLFIQWAGMQPDVLRAQDQVELLYEVTTHLNTDLSLEKVLSNVLTQALAKAGATGGSIFLLDEDNRVTHRILARENLAPEVSPLVIREIMDRGMAAWVLEHRQGTLVEDVLQDSRWLVLPDHAGAVRSAVAVPFLRRGRVQGMLFLTHPDVGRFSQEHLDLLTSIANQASIAIQNARLYEFAENERRTVAAVLDSSADAIVVIDPQGRVLLANRAAQQEVGIENRPVPLGEALLHPDLLSLLERSAAEEGAVSENVKMTDGRTLSVSVAPVRDSEGRTVGRVAAMHDITHMVALDEMKTRFVSTVSHDLKAPLTAIRGFTELIPLVGPVNTEQAQFVGRIKEVVEGMTHLVSELLDLGKIEAGLGIDMQPVNIRDLLVTSKYDLALPAQEKKILVDIETPAALPVVQGDPFRLQQVLANLLGNAVKYTPQGGHIWLRAETRGSELVVSVCDTGMGIAASDLPHVFDKFFRVQDVRVIDQEGSGLGLTIVKSIVGEHGGRVWAESTLGKGSTFYFSLPLPAGSASAIEVRADAPGEAP